MPAARPGPCAPWSDGGQLAALPWVKTASAAAEKSGQLDDEQVQQILAGAVLAASEVLYQLSGRVFSGECGPVTVRPVARPSDADTRSSALSALGWFSSYGLGSGYGTSAPGVIAHYASTDPPTIRLPYPVLDVVQVKIDGTVIPAQEYELRDHLELVRIRPSASYSPTARYGWPTSQIMDLPDTEPGTFSVTFTFGNLVPAAGQLAALKLAEFLALPQLGDSTRYPRRVTQITRQGVSAQVTDIVDVVKTGATGIYEVDVFLRAHNPGKNSRQGVVWSPDVGRARRQAVPSLPS